MTEGIIIALITGGLAIVSNVLIAWNQSSKTLYRIEQLEKKVEKHNHLVERMTAAETSIKSQQHQIDEIKNIIE